jgi:Cu2+-containing amine oxidase
MRLSLSKATTALRKCYLKLKKHLLKADEILHLLRYATYLNTSFYVSETTHTHLNSLCLFEFTADYPLQRHSTSNYVSATKNTYFTIRSVSTVGNYDYMFSYSFYLGKSPVA